MKLKTIIISWIICGALSVYAAGVIDRASGYEGDAPLTILFISGPIGLATCGIVAFLLATQQGMNPILKPLYDLGVGR